MAIELVFGLALAATVAGATVTYERSKNHARVVDNAQFQSKLERVSQEAKHNCAHCGNEVKIEEVRLLFADESGHVRVVCDRDACLLAHTQDAEHADAPIAAA